MKTWIHDILLVGAGFAAGAYFMHVRMRGEYQKFADAQIEDVSITRKKSSTLTSRSKQKLRSRLLI